MWMSVVCPEMVPGALAAALSTISTSALTGIVALDLDDVRIVMFIRDSCTAIDSAFQKIISNNEYKLCNGSWSTWATTLTFTERRPGLTCEPLIFPHAVILFPPAVKLVLPSL
ncbi:hypothetical protein AB1Y20_010967 [Prymnesium parvum]|uniref:Secreted protein n=1 Tax=Prymnesium parvum TaxID=97485 RepID=A0AB34ILX3_PRYPA